MPFQLMYLANDFIYPSAYSRGLSGMGILLPSVAATKDVSFPDAQPIVFLPEINQLEIQRASSQKIPCMVTIHSMQHAFHLFKFPHVNYIHVPFSHNPIIDMGWIGKACEENNRTIVFSLDEWLRVVARGDTILLEHYHKLIRLLHKKKIPFHFASFAQDSISIFSEEERTALASFFVTQKFPEKNPVLRVELNSMGRHD